MFFHKMFKHVKKFKDQNCKLLGVSRDGPSVLKDWMDECGWPIPVISDMNLAPKDFGVIQRLGLPLQHGYAVPSAVVIDKKGVIRTIASHSPSDGGCCVGEILRIVTALNQVVVPGDNGKLTPANWDAKQPFIVNTRKGVDDYYYRKYGLREKKYWPSTRSESKGGINNDSKEKGAKSKQEDDEVGGADNNFLTGANDILAVEDGAGQLTASPFSVQFGERDTAMIMTVFTELLQARRTSGCPGPGTWSASRSTAATCRSAWCWTAPAADTSPRGPGRRGRASTGAAHVILSHQ